MQTERPTFFLQNLLSHKICHPIKHKSTIYIRRRVCTIYSKKKSHTFGNNSNPPPPISDFFFKFLLKSLFSLRCDSSYLNPNKSLHFKIMFAYDLNLILLFYILYWSLRKRRKKNKNKHSLNFSKSFRYIKSTLA